MIIGEIKRVDRARGWHDRTVTVVDNNGELEGKAKDEIEKIIMKQYIKEPYMWFYIKLKTGNSYTIKFGYDSGD